MLVKRLFCALASLFLGFSCLIGNLDAKVLNSLGNECDEVNLKVGTKYQKKNVSLYDTVYYFTLDSKSVINLNISYKDADIKKNDSLSMYADIGYKDDFSLSWDDMKSYYRSNYSDWKYEDGLATYNGLYVLGKGTYYLSLNTSSVDDPIDNVTISINKKKASNYEIKDVTFNVRGMPVCKNIDNLKMSYVVGDEDIWYVSYSYLCSHNKGYGSDGISFYRTNDKTWLCQSVDDYSLKWLSFSNSKVKSGKYVKYRCDYPKLKSYDFIKMLNDGDNILIQTYWTPSKYGVKYISNGGYGTMKNSYHYYGTAKSLRSNTYKHKTKKFVGWKAMYLKYGSVKYWYYTNGKESGWYSEGYQPYGWKKYVFKNGEKLKEYPDIYSCNIRMYAVWK